MHALVLKLRRRMPLAGLQAAQPYMSERRCRAALARLRPAERAAAPGGKQLLVDVSVISRGDAGTGVQRVVRALLLQLLQAPPSGYNVRPIEAGRWHRYRYARAPFATGLWPAPGGKLVVGRGDLYLGLDLATYNVIRHYRQFNRWKLAGARFAFIVHDLLPVSHPEWFSRKSVNAYRGWIRNLAIYADAAFCVSRAVRDELGVWLDARLGAQRDSVSLGWFHLGGDIQASLPSAGKSPGFDAQLAHMVARPSVLMAGTLEPRKGHALALAAFEALWREGRQVNLVIVGRAGWGIDALLSRLRGHAEAGRRLIWLDDASDEMLSEVYRACAGLLMASEGEGFGLPIAEAAQAGLPILARDLPVFREIAGEHASYFRGNTPELLAADIGSWLDLVRAGRAVTSAGIRRLTWEESARMLREGLESVAQSDP
jgi:glycosyltransferase involved in cell wall biosynthesis